MINLAIALIIATILSTSPVSANNINWNDIRELAEYRIENNLSRGEIVEHLQCSTNTQLKEELQAKMLLLRYDHKYVENVFDCSNQSKILYKYLTKKGYNTKITYTYNKEDECGHAFVVVEDDNGSYVAIETVTGNGCIGGVRTSGLWYGPQILMNSIEDADTWPMMD